MAIDEQHGGNPHKLVASSCCTPSQILDFSASINPLGPSLDVLRVLRKGLRAIRDYPDPTAWALVSGLSRRSGLDHSHYLIGNGSAELLYLLPFALKINRALIIGPTFSEYKKSVEAFGGTATYLMADRNDDYRPPTWHFLKTIQEAQPKFDAVYLCNPNSPTGQLIPRQKLLPLIAALEAEGLWIVIDESFVEFAPDQSISDQVIQHPRLLVLRSFTKFYGIPGLRVGYLIGPPPVIAEVKKRQPPWSVNVLGQVAALAGLRDATYRKKTLTVVSEERQLFSDALGQLGMVRVFPSAANFLLLELPTRLSARQVADGLERQCFLVRDCSEIPGLNDRSLRVAIKQHHANIRLVKAFQCVLHH